jgi:hypothetical protein
MKELIIVDVSRVKVGEDIYAYKLTLFDEDEGETFTASIAEGILEK